MEGLENIIVKQIPIINNQDLSMSINGTVSLSSDKEYIPDGINMINAPFMWSKGITGKNVKIAVIDSGCDTDHKDLKNRIIGGRNFTTEDNGNINKYEDYNGHGTHVCGTIAASNNNYGVTGVAPDAQLLILKALDKNGSGSMKSIIDAINFAISQKVDIISMSLGTSKDIPQLHQVIKKAVDSNILVVCAAGNEGDGLVSTDEFSYPGAYNEVINVGAVDFLRSAARFSDSNKEVDLVAPGVNIVSTFLNGKYETLSGTSMATPHVTGFLALLIEWSQKEFGRKLTEVELYSQLIKNTVTLPISRTLQGNGLLFMNTNNILK